MSTDTAMLEWLKSPSGAYNLTLILTTVAWLLAGVGIFAGFHLNKVRTMDAQAKTAQAEADRQSIAAELATTAVELQAAKSQTAELRKRLAPRHLTDAQKEAMIRILQPSPRGQVEIIVPLSSGDDALAFADEIFQLLRKLEFNVATPIQAAYTPITGLRVQVKEQSSTPTAGGYLQGALREAGYKCEGILNPELTDANTVELIVGAREYE
jgi:hypothetical protein